MFGRVVVANACSSDIFMSKHLYYMRFSYEIGSHCMGRGDQCRDETIWR